MESFGSLSELIDDIKAKGYNTLDASEQLKSFDGVTANSATIRPTVSDEDNAWLVARTPNKKERYAILTDKKGKSHWLPVVVYNRGEAQEAWAYEDSEPEDLNALSWSSDKASRKKQDLLRTVISDFNSDNAKSGEYTYILRSDRVTFFDGDSPICCLVPVMRVSFIDARVPKIAEPKELFIVLASVDYKAGAYSLVDIFEV